LPKIEDGKSWLRKPKLYKGVIQPYKKKMYIYIYIYSISRITATNNINKYLIALSSKIVSASLYL